MRNLEALRIWLEDITAEVVNGTGGGAHGVLVTSSSVRAYEQAVTCVRKRGVMVCVGITPQKMHLPIGPEYFVAKAVKLTGTSTGALQDTKEVFEFVRKGEVKPIVVEKTLDEIPACMDALEKGETVGRYVVRF